MKFHVYMMKKDTLNVKQMNLFAYNIKNYEPTSNRSFDDSCC